MDLIKKMKKNKNVTIMLACIVLIFLFIFSRKKIYQKFTQQGWIKSIIDEVYIIALPERKESALENLQKPDKHIKNPINSTESVFSFEGAIPIFL